MMMKIQMKTLKITKVLQKIIAQKEEEEEVLENNIKEKHLTMMMMKTIMMQTKLLLNNLLVVNLKKEEDLKRFLNQRRIGRLMITILLQILLFIISNRMMLNEN